MVGLSVSALTVLAPPATRGDTGASVSLPPALQQEAALATFEKEAGAAGALGFYLDDASGAMVVEVPSATSDQFVMPSVDGLPLTVRERTVSLTANELSAALQDLAGVTEAASATGASYAFFFNPQEARIEIHTSIPEATIEQSLGTAMSLVDYHLDPVVPLGRGDDSAPFWGGATVWRPPLGPQCTTAFTVKDTETGKVMMATAGHCFTAGNIVESGSNNETGTVIEQWCGSTGKDMELIAGETYGGVIYVGGATGTASSVKGASNPSVNGTYQYSGANTYQNAVTVTSVSGGGFNYGCGNMSSLIVAHTYGGSGCPAVTGDSGAPIYLPSGSTSYIRGMLVAKDSTNCYGELWSTIANTLGVSIVTS